MALFRNYLNKKKIIELVYLTIVMLFPIVIVYIAYGKGFDLNIYTTLGGDSFGTAAIIKGIQENGPIGVYYNPRIGAPEVAIYFDYPFMGNLMTLIVWIESWFIKSNSVIVYVYIFVTYALSALTMAMLLRKLEFNKFISFAMAELFALAPFHFYRTGHLTLINYMVIPVAIYLSLYILDYFDNEKKWKVAISAVILGLGYGYYYVFGLMIMFIAFLMYIGKIGKVSEFFKKLWPFVVVLMTVVISLLPKMIYTAQNGKNETIQRYFFEQEIYGLKIINLLLPVQYSSIGNIKDITEEYNQYVLYGSENIYAGLGIIASLGFIIICVLFIYSFVKKKSNTDKQWLLIDYLALSTLALLLFCSIGGFGEIFNWIVTPQIRCQNRASIFIMAYSLIMVAIVLDKLSKKLIFLIPVICVIIVIGFFDQVGRHDDNWQEPVKSKQVMLEGYFKTVEDSLDKGSMVYELPFMRFPENGTMNELIDYQLFYGYLFTDELKWSYGAMVGRNFQSAELYIDEGMSNAFLQGIQKAGFSAVYIDLAGYEDGGEKVLEFYNSLGIEPIVSEDGKLYTYNISGLKIND